MRRYLAHWSDEVPRFIYMLDLIAQGAAGHGPVFLMLTSSAEIGFAWECFRIFTTTYLFPPAGKR